MASRSFRVLLVLVAATACNSSQPNSPRRAEPGSTPEATRKSRPPPWQRDAVAMPEAFARFPTSKLEPLVGQWLVASEIPGQRELWIVEEQGRKLTIVDARGRERIHGLTLQSPCSLAITDEGGRTRSRRFAWIGDRLHTHPNGATAIAASDGAMIVCAGSQTIVVPLAGPCVGFSEMLGVWSELGTPAGTCALTQAGDAPAELVIGERRLRAIEGVWMDAVLEQALAERVADRAAGEQALAKPAPAPAPSSSATETTQGVG